jgi:hypothetical protein
MSLNSPNWLKSPNWNGILAIFTGLLFATTGAIALLGYCQFREIAKTDRTQLRAYVGLDGFVMPTGFDPVGDIRNYNVYVKWLNSGRTDTNHLILETNCNVSSVFIFQDTPTYALQPRINKPSLSPSRGAKFLICGGPVDRWLSYRGHPQYLFLWGRAIYHDIFSKRWHLTEFNYRIGDFTGAPSESNFGASSIEAIGKEHNCADDECFSYRDKGTFEPPAQ